MAVPDRICGLRVTSYFTGGDCHYLYVVNPPPGMDFVGQWQIHCPLNVGEKYRVAHYEGSDCDGVVWGYCNTETEAWEAVCQSIQEMATWCKKFVDLVSEE